MNHNKTKPIDNSIDANSLNNEDVEMLDLSNKNVLDDNNVEMLDLSDKHILDNNWCFDISNINNKLNNINNMSLNGNFENNINNMSLNDNFENNTNGENSKNNTNNNFKNNTNSNFEDLNNMIKSQINFIINKNKNFSYQLDKMILSKNILQTWDNELIFINFSYIYENKLYFKKLHNSFNKINKSNYRNNAFTNKLFNIIKNNNKKIVLCFEEIYNYYFSILYPLIKKSQLNIIYLNEYINLLDFIVKNNINVYSNFLSRENKEYINYENFIRIYKPENYFNNINFINEKYKFIEYFCISFILNSVKYSLDTCLNINKKCINSYNFENIKLNIININNI